jgi:hypothetical protein
MGDNSIQYYLDCLSKNVSSTLDKTRWIYRWIDPTVKNEVGIGAPEVPNPETTLIAMLEEVGEIGRNLDFIAMKLYGQEQPEQDETYPILCKKIDTKKVSY